MAPLDDMRFKFVFPPSTNQTTFALEDVVTDEIYFPLAHVISILSLVADKLRTPSLFYPKNF